ncbi:neuromedin-U-25 isoform X2 [Oryctolagus cuniculus]|uniref:neuromedin-U-25 isoform X2 n=1 Tax=Oryctolagus cuniculus TaxID=9986 RepID=UPI0022316628|nr:neuromedin-U-25 isoform X2 [Oryctolagus cuniculus]
MCEMQLICQQQWLCREAPRGAPVLSYGLYPEQELQLWNKIQDACLPFLSVDSQPQAPDTLRELCLMLMGIPPRPQEQDEKDNTKRFLFHYSKTQKLGNSNVVSSVLHPLLQLLPHLHERRMKRFPVDVRTSGCMLVRPLCGPAPGALGEEFQSPFGSRSRGYFLFRNINTFSTEAMLWNITTTNICFLPQINLC